MPLHSASYFAGVGTVVATMAIGFGGGVMLTDAFVGKSERAQTLMERRASPLTEATPVAAAVPAAQPDSPQVSAPSAAQPPSAEQQSAPQQAVAPQQPTNTSQQQANAPQMIESQQTAAQPVQASAQTAAQERPGFEQSMGQVREVDLRQRDADVRKAAAERRKQERRKWAERRKREMENIDELAAVTEKVKQIDRQREREPVIRTFRAESGPPAPAAFGLLGSDDED